MLIMNDHCHISRLKAPHLNQLSIHDLPLLCTEVTCMFDQLSILCPGSSENGHISC